MADYMLYVGCDGIDDPNQAGLVFAAARGAVNHKPPYEAQIALLADAVLLMKDTIARNTIISPIKTAKIDPPPPPRGSVADLLTQIPTVQIWV